MKLEVTGGPDEEDEKDDEEEYERPSYDSDGNELHYDDHGRSYWEDNSGNRYEPGG